MKSGIYQIVCRTTEERYIGSSVNIIKRWSQHRSKLRKGEHRSATLQAAWDTYGEGDFFFGVIMYLPQEEMRATEISWLQAAEPAYNTSDIKGRRRKTFGKPLSAEHRQRMSQVKLGRGRGYCWDKAKGKWKAQIKINGKSKTLGYHTLEADAAAAHARELAKYKTP